ncbi:head GIN domain-containing protein [Winogradskyella sp. PE311]|uniref:head GIN domain-containing protein n=1 Tax=Winogradskyella sp. PE311 TaxID=3366943 RepID=UPI00397EF5CA
MKNLKHILIITLVILGQSLKAQSKKTVDAFNKVIISPHIETTFVQGDEESVTILENTLSNDIVNIEVNNGTLRVYLDDAKMTTKQEKRVENGMKMKVPIYKGKVLTVKVTYKTIDDLSLRGEQSIVCDSSIEVDEFRLKIYGESEVTFNAMNVKNLSADIYGESQLVIKKGVIDYQRITAYGEGEINVVDVKNRKGKYRALGEAIFRVNTSEHIKFTAFGEAELYYKGNPEIDRGFGVGASTIDQIN